MVVVVVRPGAKRLIDGTQDTAWDELLSTEATQHLCRAVLDYPSQSVNPSFDQERLARMPSSEPKFNCPQSSLLPFNPSQQRATRRLRLCC